MSDVHITPSGGGWAVKVDGAERETFDTQEQAIERGRTVAEEEHGELVVHGQGGEIREKDSHGNDPRDIPG
jgi:Uncharacterized protein conserved in bacteria (DUF2188)